MHFLGHMLKRTTRFPYSLILPYYQGCLHTGNANCQYFFLVSPPALNVFMKVILICALEDQRNLLGLEPFYSLLDRHNILDLSIPEETSALLNIIVSLYKDGAAYGANLFELDIDAANKTYSVSNIFLISAHSYFQNYNYNQIFTMTNLFSRFSVPVIYNTRLLRKLDTTFTRKQSNQHLNICQS